MSHEQKMRHVDHIIDALDLRQCQHTSELKSQAKSGAPKRLRASVSHLRLSALKKEEA